MSRFARLGALLVLPLAIACEDEGPDLSREEVAGVYILQTVNNQPLPFSNDNTPPILELLDLQLVLEVNGEFSERAIARETDGDVVVTDTTFDGGEYDLDGDAIQLRYDDGGRAVGRFDLPRLQFSGGGLTFLFERE